MLKRFAVVTVLAIMQALPATRVPQAAPPAASAGVTFQDFNGVNYHMPVELHRQLGIGWDREGFAWAGIEPQKGQWSWEKTDGLVRGYGAQGVQILPLLAYTAPWAESIAGKDKSPPKSVQDWEDFVEHVVAHYSSPPFNLRYYQIWNEPTRQAGFWTGTDQQFIDSLYLPAAKIIRQHHCFVVFGGWPQSNSLQELDNVLSYHDAWRWTDIVDVHYLNPPAWQHIYDQWIKTGKCRGIWETEIGYTADPDFLPNAYLHLLNWTLQSGWNDRNQYKVFWFASWGNANDRLSHLTRPVGTEHFSLTQNGTELRTMNEVLGGGPLASFTGFATSPALPAPLARAPSAVGFKVGGNRIVVALLLNQATRQAASVQISIPGKPQQVQLVSAVGVRKPLPISYQGGKLSLKLAPGDLPMDCPTCQWTVNYLQVDGL